MGKSKRFSVYYIMDSFYEGSDMARCRSNVVFVVFPEVIIANQAALLPFTLSTFSLRNTGLTFFLFKKKVEEKWPSM